MHRVVTDKSVFCFSPLFWANKWIISPQASVFYQATAFQCLAIMSWLIMGCISLSHEFLRHHTSHAHKVSVDKMDYLLQQVLCAKKSSRQGFCCQKLGPDEEKDNKASKTIAKEWQKHRWGVNFLKTGCNFFFFSMTSWTEWDENFGEAPKSAQRSAEIASLHYLIEMPMLCNCCIKSYSGLNWPKHSADLDSQEPTER